MLLAAFLALSAPALQEDAYSVVLQFEKMHCDECKAELETTLKKLQGVKAVSIADAAATLSIADAAPVPQFNRLPKDLSLKLVSLTLRGTAGFAGDKATLVAKGSGMTLVLANAAGQDKLAELKAKLGGKNRFQVSGALHGKTLQLASFQPADWKD
jgi:copper chaperone CopZ